MSLNCDVRRFHRWRDPRPERGARVRKRINGLPPRPMPPSAGDGPPRKRCGLVTLCSGERIPGALAAIQAGPAAVYKGERHE
jgi:hypothetical protein